MKLNIVDIIALILVIIGGLNWGLVGLVKYNLVESLLGAISLSGLASVIYILVGLAAVYSAVILVKLEKR